MTCQWLGYAHMSTAAVGVPLTVALQNCVAPSGAACQGLRVRSPLISMIESRGRNNVEAVIEFSELAPQFRPIQFAKSFRMNAAVRPQLCPRCIPRGDPRPGCARIGLAYHWRPERYDECGKGMVTENSGQRPVGENRGQRGKSTSGLRAVSKARAPLRETKGVGMVRAF